MAKFTKKKIDIEKINSGNTYRNDVDDVQADTINAVVEGCAFSDSVAEEAKTQSDTAVSAANNALREAHSANYKSDNAQNAAFQAQKTASNANATSEQARTKSLEAVATANKIKSLGENQPDVSDANTVGLATATIEELSDGGLRFKFSNLKGAKGDSGAAQHITLDYATSGVLSQEDLNVLLSSEVNYVVINQFGYETIYTPNVRADEFVGYLFADVQVNATLDIPKFNLFVLNTITREWEMQIYDSSKKINGKVSKAGDTMTGSLEITGTNPGGWSLKATGNVGGDRLYEGDVRVYSPNNLPTASDIGAEPALRETVIDATGLDENTWYPVTIPLWENKLCTIEIRNALHDGSGNPSWSTHTDGFSAFAKWSVRGNGWGSTAQNRAIREITWSFADNVFGEIGQLSHSSNEYIYVRGGAKYHFHCSEGAGTPILRTSTFTQFEESISPTTTHSMNYMLNAIDTGQVNAEIYDNKQRVFSPNNPQAYLPSVNGNVSLQYNGFWTSSSEPLYVMVSDPGSPLPMKHMQINSNFYTAQRPFRGKKLGGTVLSGGQITNPTMAMMIVTIWATETSQYGTLEIRDAIFDTRAAYVEGEHGYWGASTLCITAVIQGGHNAIAKGSKVGTINYSAVCLSYN